MRRLLTAGLLLVMMVLLAASTYQPESYLQGWETYTRVGGSQGTSFRATASAGAATPQQEGGATFVLLKARAKLDSPSQVGIDFWDGTWSVLVDTTAQAAAAVQLAFDSLDTLMANGDTLYYRAIAYIASAPVDTVERFLVINVPDIVAPTLSSFAIASWDSGGTGGTLQISVTGGANEPSNYLIRYGTTPAEMNAHAGDLVTAGADTLNETIDTGIAPYGGAYGEPLYASVVVYDIAGNIGAGASGWITVSQGVGSAPEILEFDFAYAVAGDDLVLSSFGTASVEHFYVEQELRYWVHNPGVWSHEWGAAGIPSEAQSWLAGPDWSFVVTETGIVPLMTAGLDSVAVRTRIGSLRGDYTDWLYVQHLYEELSAVVTMGYTINGGSAQVTAEVVPSDYGYQMNVLYSSSYEDLFEGDPQYAYKARAAGAYTGTIAAAASSGAITIPDGVYHTDTLSVHLAALDSLGAPVGEPTEVYSGVINMPLGDVPPINHTGYRVAGHVFGALWYLGGNPPYGFGLNFDDLAKSDLLLVGSQAVGGTYQHADPLLNQGRWKGWLHKVWDEPGSRQPAVIGFTGTAYRPNVDQPLMRRWYERLNQMYLAAFEEGGTAADSNVWVHTYDGEVAYVEGEPNPSVPYRLLNLTYAPGRAAAIKGFVEELDHGDNRLPLTGYMFDVWENYSDYPIWWDGGLVSALSVADFNLNGVAAYADSLDMRAFREARRVWFQELRAALEVQTDPLDAKYFIFGANSASAAGDSLLAAEIDYIYLEDFMTPCMISNGYWYLTGNSSTRQNYTYPYHFALDPNYTIVYDEDYWTSTNRWNVLFAEDLPAPTDYKPHFANLKNVMRTEAGGPWINLISAGDATSSENIMTIDPVYNEVWSLLSDNVYAAYMHYAIRHEGYAMDRNTIKQWDHPDNYGLPSLRDLGSPLGAATSDTIGNEILWTRMFSNGSVQVVIADTANFNAVYPDGQDLFDFRVIQGGVVVREAGVWDAPLDLVVLNFVSAYVDTTTASNMALGVSVETIGSPFAAEVAWRHKTAGAWVPAAWKDATTDTVVSMSAEFFTSLATGLGVGDLTAGVDSFAVRVRVNPDTTATDAYSWSAPAESRVLYERAVIQEFAVELAGYTVDSADSVRVFMDVSAVPNAAFCVTYKVGAGGTESSPLCTAATDTFYAFWDQVNSHAALGGETVYVYVYNEADSLVASESFVVTAPVAPTSEPTMYVFTRMDPAKISISTGAGADPDTVFITDPVDTVHVYTSPNIVHVDWSGGADAARMSVSRLNCANYGDANDYAAAPSQTYMTMGDGWPIVNTKLDVFGLYYADIADSLVGKTITKAYFSLSHQNSAAGRPNTGTEIYPVAVSEPVLYEWVGSGIMGCNIMYSNISTTTAWTTSLESFTTVASIGTQAATVTGTQIRANGPGSMFFADITAAAAAEWNSTRAGLLLLHGTDAADKTWYMFHSGTVDAPRREILILEVEDAP